jgi:hypothetical protein
MSRRRSLQARIDDYLAERRRQGFQLRSRDVFLPNFARFVEAKHHQGPLTAEIMVEWVRAGKDGHGDAGTWASSWRRLRFTGDRSHHRATSRAAGTLVLPKPIPVFHNAAASGTGRWIRLRSAHREPNNDVSCRMAGQSTIFRAPGRLA